MTECPHRGALGGKEAAMPYKTEYLGGGISVFCSDDHRFGTDAVLLENFAERSAPDAKKILDLGCGCGIIPMLFARDRIAPYLAPHSAPRSTAPTDRRDIQITALDIQPQAIELVNAAIAHNGLGAQVNAVCRDLRELKSDRNCGGAFDLVTMNPPYKRAGAGLMSDNEALNIARFELKCTFADICASAAQVLKRGGKFCVCNRPDRLCDMLCAMRASGIEPKVMRTVALRVGRPPMLVLIEGVKGGKPDLELLPALYLEDDNGALTPDAAQIYEKWEYERKNAAPRRGENR